jgi:hypothetical protein
MQSDQTDVVSRKRLWTGRVLSGLAVLFLLFDSISKLMNVGPVVQAFAQLGYPARLIPVIGTILLVCVIVYLIPRTAILGAILITGYLGGAIASNLRIGTPLFSNALFPLYVAALVWGGLYLRDDRARALIARPR